MIARPQRSLRMEGTLVPESVRVEKLPADLNTCSELLHKQEINFCCIQAITYLHLFDSAVYLAYPNEYRCL